MAELGRATIVYETASGEVEKATVDNDHIAYFQDHWLFEYGTDDEGNDIVRRVPSERVYHVERSVEELEETFRQRPTEEWVSRIKQRGIPVSEINDTHSVWEDEHTKAREMQFDVKTESGESFPTISYPVKHETWEWEGDEYIAPLGADTEDVLKAAGYDDEKIEALREEGVI